MDLNRANKLRELEAAGGNRRTKQIEEAEAGVLYFRQILQKYGVPEDAIVFVEREAGCETKYFAEKRSSYELATQRLDDSGDIPRNSWMIADAGNELKFSLAEGGKSIFHQFGIPNVATIPSAPHHAINPLDSHVHGICKQQTRAELKNDFRDDMLTTVCLLSKLRAIDPASVEKWFKANFAYGVDRNDDEALQAAAQKIVEGNVSRWAKYHEECLVEYYAAYPDEMVEPEELPEGKRRRGLGGVVTGQKAK
jgi:hypothetical protein